MPVLSHFLEVGGGHCSLFVVFYTLIDGLKMVMSMWWIGVRILFRILELNLVFEVS